MISRSRFILHKALGFAAGNIASQTEELQMLHHAALEDKISTNQSKKALLGLDNPEAH